MNQSVKFTIITITYNATQWLERTILSILSQSYGNIEVIVVDDHSIDNSKSVIKRFVEQDKRVRLLENEENCGPAWSRKRGYEMASGKYYIFCDSDENAILRTSGFPYGRHER